MNFEAVRQSYIDALNRAIHLRRKAFEREHKIADSEKLLFTNNIIFIFASWFKHQNQFTGAKHDELKELVETAWVLYYGGVEE